MCNFELILLTDVVDELCFYFFAFLVFSSLIVVFCIRIVLYCNFCRWRIKVLMSKFVRIPDTY